MPLGQQLGRPQLDGITEVARQLAQEPIELLRPRHRLGSVLPPHRLKLEHEAAGVVAKHPRVRPEHRFLEEIGVEEVGVRHPIDRKSTRLNSSHTVISYAVFCLKKKKKKEKIMKT